MLLGEDQTDKKTFDEVFEAIRGTKTKSVCLDWFNLDSKTFDGITEVAKGEEVLDLKSFHLTMIDLGDQQKMKGVCSIVSNNVQICDLILTFCRINDETIQFLSKALAVNNKILSINLNYNLLRRAGYLELAKGLVQNNTLRYLEVKANKAEKKDLMKFIEDLEENHSLEFIDVGQADDIDGVIMKNNIPEELPTKKKSLFSILKTEKPGVADVRAAASTRGDVAVVPNANDGGANNADTAAEEDPNVLETVKRLVDRNKSDRKTKEKNLKLEQLNGILDTESSQISASLKHCKILMLGEKGCGKTFFAHCLVHQLYDPERVDEGKDSAEPAKRKLNRLSFGRVTELGWTKISTFSHVDVILAKYIASLPVNKQNRLMANEVCFQFPEDVQISGKDIQVSVLTKEDEEMLARLKISNRAQTTPDVVPPVFKSEEKNDIKRSFNNNMDDIIDKAVRENNYPSFSIWDMDSPPGFDEVFRAFYNNHGMIYVFFNLAEMKTHPEKSLNSILKYLKPITVAKKSNRNFTSKVFLIGTFLDKLINDGIDDDLDQRVAAFDELVKNGTLGAPDDQKDNHVNFLMNGLENASDVKVMNCVQKMLMWFNKQLEDALGKSFPEVVPNDENDLMFFPVSNYLPKRCENFKHDFDDITGINRFRRKVKQLIQTGEIEVINVMKTLRDAKMIDALMERRNIKRQSDIDHRSDYILRKDFEALANQAGIASQADIAILLRYLDVTGVVSWLTSSETLQNVIVLNPDYILDGLSKFYDMCGKDGAERNAELAEEAKSAGLVDDVNHLKEHRIVSHDLLLQKLLQRDNFTYFLEFLKQSLHLNQINVTAVLDTFSKHNFFEMKELDELFLVPHFDGEPVQERNMEHVLFTQLRLKFVPASGMFLTGTFERAFTLFIDSLHTPGMKDKLNGGDPGQVNSLHYSRDCAAFQFGEESVTINRFVGNAENEQEGYLQVDFSSEKCIGLLLEFVQGVMRKLENEFVNEFAFVGYLFTEGNKWVEVNEARRVKLSPYFNQATQKVNTDILANVDNI